MWLHMHVYVKCLIGFYGSELVGRAVKYGFRNLHKLVASLKACVVTPIFFLRGGGWIIFVVLKMRALIFGVCIRAPDFWKLPDPNPSTSPCICCGCEDSAVVYRPTDVLMYCIAGTR